MAEDPKDFEFNVGNAIKSAGTVLKAGAILAGGREAVAQSRAVAAAREFQAKQLEVRAGQERAAAQRRFLEQRRRGRLLQSSLQARAAASGAGATDPTVNKLATGIESEADYLARTALFEGEEAGRALESGAALRRFEGAEALRAGRARRKASQRSAVTTLLGQFEDLSLFSKYGEPMTSVASPWVNPDIGKLPDEFAGP